MGNHKLFAFSTAVFTSWDFHLTDWEAARNLRSSIRVQAPFVILSTTSEPASWRINMTVYANTQPQAVPAYCQALFMVALRPNAAPRLIPYSCVSTCVNKQSLLRIQLKEMIADAVDKDERLTESELFAQQMQKVRWGSFMLERLFLCTAN